MAIERKWLAIEPRPLTSNGMTFGGIVVASTAGFRTKMIVGLKSDTQQPAAFQVKEVISATEMIVGVKDATVGRNAGTDVSRFTVADHASIHAVEQEKTNIPEKDHYSAIYEADPVVADRVISVDELGRFYNDENPLPTSTKLERLRQITPDSFDDVIIVRDAEDYPIVYRFLLNNVDVGGIDVTYNDNRSAVRYKRNDNE